MLLEIGPPRLKAGGFDPACKYFVVVLQKGNCVLLHWSAVTIACEILNSMFGFFFKSNKPHVISIGNNATDLSHSA